MDRGHSCLPDSRAGNSGPLEEEISWNELTEIGGNHDLIEPQRCPRIRRVARFIRNVKRAIAANLPTSIVLTT